MTAAPAEAGFDLAGRRVFVAGHGGMVGSALVRRLAREGCEVLTASRARADLVDQSATRALLADMRPDAVFLAAAKVGGILANDTRPAEFLYENLMIEANVIEAAHAAGVAKLMFLGSSCIYPRDAPQPIAEDALLTGPLEPTNEWYAVAKIAGIKLCQAYRRQHGADFISAMPTNLYGTGDNYDPASSHVLPAMVRRVVEAREAGRREITIWGTGAPLREFMHADDLDVRGLVGGGRRDEYDFHGMIFDAPSLSAALREAGFAEVRAWDWRETEHAGMDDYSQAYMPHMDKENGTLVSLNLEGVKR